MTMFVPLGFGTKSPKIPFFSWTVCALIAAFSIMEFPKLNKIDDELVVSNEYLAFRGAQKNLTSKLCESNKISSAVCKRMILTFSPLEKGKEKDRQESLKQIKLSVDESGEMNRLFEGISRPDLLKKKWKHLSPELDSAQMQIDDWNEKYTANQARTEKALAEFNILTPHHITWMAALRSFSLHQGWLHLLGNLFVLFFFLRILEQRWTLPMLGTSLMVGGIGGLLMQILVHGNGMPGILGASAGVSAIIGSFWIAYFHQKVRILLLDPIAWFSKQKIYVSVSWFVPLIFVGLDIAGELARNQSLGSVAHFAHLSGFAIGAICAWIFESQLRLGSVFLYPEERAKIISWRVRTVVPSLSGIEQVLAWNPYQKEALEKGLVIAHVLGKKGEPFVESWLPRFVGACGSPKDEAQVLKVLTAFNSLPTWNSPLRMANPHIILKLGKILLKHGNWLSALKVYTVMAENFAKQETSEKICRSIFGIIQFAVQDPSNVEALKAWRAGLSNSILIQLVDRDFPTMQMGAADAKRQGA